MLKFLHMKEQTKNSNICFQSVMLIAIAETLAISVIITKITVINPDLMWALIYLLLQLLHPCTVTRIRIKLAAITSWISQAKRNCNSWRIILPSWYPINHLLRNSSLNIKTTCQSIQFSTVSHRSIKTPCIICYQSYQG